MVLTEAPLNAKQVFCTSCGTRKKVDEEERKKNMWIV
jgi:uncharacterized Zn finger protein (UPF0148 family)